MSAPGRLPVFVLTGFLGAGKTTLLNRLLGSGELPGSAVIVNEFGETGLDAAFLGAAGGEVLEMAGGCLCCAWQGGLAETLLQLPAERLARVIVETSGIADPAPVLEQLAVATASGLPFRAGGVIAVVDAANGPANLAERDEARRQVALADAIVLTKRDLAAPDALRRPVRELNPHSPEFDGGDIAAIADLLRADRLLLPSVATPPGNAHRDRGHDHAHDHDHGHTAGARHGDLASLSIRHEPPLALAALTGFFALVASAHGGRVLRMKALANVAGRPVALHSVRGVVHEPQFLPAWPNADRATRLVAIFRDMEAEFLERLFAGYCGAPAADTADAAAFDANPLAVPGYAGPSRPRSIR